MGINIDYELISKNPIFRDIGAEDINTMLTCMDATVKNYRENNYVFFTGEHMDALGVLLSGRLEIIKENEDGIRSIIATVTPGESFGEAFVCTGISSIPVSVVATADSSVLFIDYKHITTRCHSACAFHTRFIQNMLGLLAEKILLLNNRLDILAKRKTREKLLTFFEQQKKLAGKNKFTIPYNREELADFLFVERSAMSAELSRMQQDGLIRFHKNKFEILD